MSIKFYWHIAMLTCLHTPYGSFCTTVAEWSSYEAKQNIYSPALDRKSLLTLVVE